MRLRILEYPKLKNDVIAVANEVEDENPSIALNAQSN